MPRDGSGVASKPAGTTFTPNTTIESSKVNSLADDIYSMLNSALPITVGGTGSSTAATARTALGAAGLADENTFTKTQIWAKGADVASANALTLGDDGNYFDITGTTTITSIATVGVGAVVKLHFDAALTLTHHATDLILPGGANITTAAGDEAEFVEYASGDWRCVSYMFAAAAPLQFASALDQELATSASKAITPSVQHFHPSAAKIWGQVTVTGGVPSLAASYNITSIADTDVGRVTVTIANDFSSAQWASSVTILGGGATNTIPQISNKGSGSFILRSISLADAFADPAGYDFIGFGDL